MTDTIANPDTPSYTPEFGYGGFWRRFVSFLFDGIIVGLITSPFTFAIATNSGNSGFHASTSSLFSFIISAAYILFFWTYKNGQTIGKKIMGLRVIKENGDSLDFSTALTRYFSYLLSSAVLMLGLISVAFDRKKQGWHDHIANTYVIKTDNKKRVGIYLLVGLLYFLIFGLITVTIIFGALFLRENNSLGQEFKKSITQEISKSDPETESDFATKQDALFTLINNQRSSNKLQVLKNDPTLCAYAQRRLEQVSSLGRYDDAKGMIEDINNSQIVRTYFSTYKNIFEQYALNSPSFSSQTIFDSLTQTERNIANDRQSTNVCVRMNQNSVMIISAIAK